MPVNTPHKSYAKFLPRWTRCRAAAEGEDAVKAGKEAFLPRLSGQSDSEYEAYLMRAAYYATMGRTVKAMTGAVLFREPTIEAVSEVEALLERCGVEGESFDEILRDLFVELLSVGRVGVLVDATQVFTTANSNPEPYLAVYKAEAIVNWRLRKKSRHEDSALSMLVLREQVDVPAAGGDPWAMDQEERYRVLYLGFPGPATEDEAKMQAEDFLNMVGLTMNDVRANPNGIYYQEVYEQQKVQTQGGAMDERWAMTERIIPRMRGGSFFQEIPFVVFNATSTTVGVEDPPLLDLVNVSMSHFRDSADLQHGRHFTALPTPWAVGWGLKPGQTLKIGSTSAWVTDEPNARCGYLEFTGTGLAAIADGMRSKESTMAMLGARLLVEPKAGVESAEAIALRQGGEKSALADMVGSVEEGAAMLLQHLASWLNVAEAASTEQSVELNKDFFLASLDPMLLSSLIGAVQQGMLSWNSLFFNLKRADLIPSDVTEEDERGRIGMSAPGSFNPALALTIPGSTPPDEGGPPPEPPVEGIPPRVNLNGAQITAAREVVRDVTTKALTPEQGRALLLAVGIPEAAAAEMILTKKIAR